MTIPTTMSEGALCPYTGIRTPFLTLPHDRHQIMPPPILLPLLLLLTLSARSARAFGSPTIPLNWSTVYPCAVDNGARVIAGDITTQYTDNTPATCIERCDAAGFAYAGVEFSNECHCGTGLKSTPVAAPVTDCNMACTGDADLSCGGSFRIQVWSSRASSYVCARELD